MNGFFDKIRNSHHLIYRLFLAILVIAAIVYALPKEAVFKYEYEKGGPWLHEDLIAQFDFPLVKEDNQLKEERDLLEAGKKLYFENKDEVPDLVKKDFLNDIQIALPDDTAMWYYGEKIIDSLYSIGIIRMNEALDNIENNDIIYLVQDNRESLHEFGEFLTLASTGQVLQAKADRGITENKLIVINKITDHLRASIIFDATLTQKVLDESLNQITKTYGKVRKGTKIVGRGDIISDEQFVILNSYREIAEQRMGSSSNTWIIISGQIILVASILIILIIYLSFFQKDIAKEANKFTFIMFIILTMFMMSLIAVYNPIINIYMLPFAMFPIITRNFFDARVSSFIHIISILLVGLQAPNAFEFIFIQSITGLAAIFSLVSLRKRSQALSTALLIFITSCLLYLGFYQIKEGSLNAIEWVQISWFAIGALLTLLAYPLIFAFEKPFGMISEATLMELSDTNNTLLRELATKAPGTFQHSLQVANLAEEAIIHIGGNPHLMRAGALYHDIGKMHNPAFFIENQAGHYNPHEHLTPTESAKMIIKHVITGIEMAKKNRLPDQIIDFIRTHHGTTLTRFFYYQAKKENPDVSEKDYQYPGPIPFSKETAVLMMADSVEAASRSLTDYTEESIENLIDNIIDGQAAAHQFDEANITFKDISRIKKILKKRIMNIYHVRIAYPD